MKIKSLLIGMLASVALVGCTDDDLIDSQASDNEKVRAYVSLVVNTATNSSRAETGGDTHGKPEHSGHENQGTTEENAVNSVLYILAQTDDDYADDGIISKNETVTTKTFQVQSTGTYDALVVINPVEGLLNAITDEMSPREAYDKVLEYEYVPSETTNDAAMNTYKKGGFMMANQTAVQITVAATNNSPETAASGVINVERAIAKITFREKAAADGMSANVYPVTISKDVYKSVSQCGWYIFTPAQFDSDGKEIVAAVWKHDNFNSANNGTVWVRVKNALSPSDLGQVLAKDFNSVFEGIYTRGTEKHLGYVSNQQHHEEIFTPVIEGLPAQIILDKGEKQPNGKTETYYVKLEKYALTNLSKKIYAVRHKTADWKTITPMGQLGASEYLVDPNSVNKNSADVTATDFNGGTYFYNPLTLVAGEAEALINNTTTTTYFKDLNGISDQTPQGENNANSSGAANVTGSYHNGSSSTDIGQFMSYCFENAVTATKQVNGLVTGIIFAGQIYTDAACTKAVDVMYKYKGEFYRELRDLLANNSSDTFKDASGNTVTLTDYSTDEAAASVVGLDVYKDGKCFYYANEIKHFDNNTPTDRGVMEFAIMRNNIYSLKINTISAIGSSTVEPAVSAPVEDEGAYISMTAEILPWSVRFNNLDL